MDLQSLGTPKHKKERKTQSMQEFADSMRSCMNYTMQKNVSLHILLVMGQGCTLPV